MEGQQSTRRTVSRITKTYFEATGTFLVRSSQVDSARVTAQAFLVIVIVLELGRGLRLGAGIEEGARRLHGHRMDGSVDYLRTRVATPAIATASQDVNDGVPCRSRTTTSRRNGAERASIIRLFYPPCGCCLCRPMMIIINGEHAEHKPERRPGCSITLVR